MIRRETLTKDWIMQVRKKPGLIKSDPTLIEKMIFAFYLLENLAKQNIDFIFKGGTSLILITNESHRLSIDIDITSSISRYDLEAALDNIVRDSEFESFKLDERRSYDNSDIPKAHYSFQYQSNFSSMGNYILLDILFQENHYSEIIELNINTDWLITEEPFLTVNTPSINSILGDKLTAFVPNTTGVPYQTGKEMEIVKQLFDISMLINKADNYNVVNSSFLKIVQSEIEFRQLPITGDDVLDDIFDTALLIAKRDMSEGTYQEKFNEIKDGLLKISGYIIGSTFRIDNAIEASAKSALLAMKLKYSNYSPIELYNPKIDLSKLQIENRDYQFLNKLRKANKPVIILLVQMFRREGVVKVS